MLKYIFIVIMIIYLAVCLLSLGYKLIAFTIEQGALNFSSIKIILTDGLFYFDCNCNCKNSFY
ncbi:hypothetical protein MASR2M54_03760 [Aliarcobacter cryaerophilus]